MASPPPGSTYHDILMDLLQPMTNTFYSSLAGAIHPYASGYANSPIMIVGESWGTEENLSKKPFIGQSGQELTRMLTEAGIDRDQQCYITNCFNAKPENNEAWRFFNRKDSGTPMVANLHPNDFARKEITRLYSEINAVKPKIIIAAGNYALWALTGHGGYDTAKDKATKSSTGVRAPTGIHTWRGSQTYYHPIKELHPNWSRHPIPVLPIIHPAAIMQMWDLRAITVHDLRRAERYIQGKLYWDEPQRTYTIPKSQADFFLVLKWLDHVLNRLAQISMGKLQLACDIETFAPMLVCVGFAMSSSSAISIPFVRVANPQDRAANVQFESFWSPSQEAQIIKRMRKILSHPNVSLIGQNFLYDTQYLEEEFGVIPRCEFDTMLAHHLIFPGTPKGLDWLSSLYCEHHKYWKDDGKDWHVNDDLEAQLKYNCLDCCKTIEIANELESILEAMGLQSQWAETMDRWRLSARMTRRGVLIDKTEVKKQTLSIMLQKQKIEAWLLTRFPQDVAGSGTGKALWFDSPKQLALFLYGKDGLGLTPIKDRKTKSVSTGKEALEELRHRYPRLMPLFDALSALRSLSVFMSHFLKKPVDPDGRMRCSYGPAGTETFRFNSSENAFGRGTNLQNIPSGNEE